MPNEASPKDFLGVQAAILLPAGQSFVSALAVGSMVGSLAILFHAENPWAIGSLAAGVAFGIAWLVSLSWWRSRVEGLRSVQEVIYPSETVRLEVYSDLDTNYPRGIFNDVVISSEALEWALIHLSNGGDLSMGAMTGPGKISRAEFCTIRDVLIKNGLAAWRNPRSPQQGSVLLVAGKHATMRYLNGRNPPSHEDMALRAV